MELGLPSSIPRKTPPHLAQCPHTLLVTTAGRERGWGEKELGAGAGGGREGSDRAPELQRDEGHRLESPPVPCPELRFITGRAALGMRDAGVETSTSRARFLQRGLKSCLGVLRGLQPGLRLPGARGRGCGRSAARLSAFLRPIPQTAARLTPHIFRRPGPGRLPLHTHAPGRCRSWLPAAGAGGCPPHTGGFAPPGPSPASGVRTWPWVPALGQEQPPEPRG